MAPAPTAGQISKTVCVMDASGQAGTCLVERLLQKGYAVHAAIHSHGYFLLMEHKNLTIFQSDPFDYQSIMSAIKGCSGLFYMFEPPPYQTSYDEFIVDVEVRAAHNVLEACAQTETIEKVIFTSSVTAVIWNDNCKLDEEFDERSWSQPNFCKKFKLWHALSKTSAERAAWALAMDRGISMVSINAGLMKGPDLSISHPYLKGAAEMFQGGVLVTVDVEFLIEAHVRVFEVPSSYGRYLCFNDLINREDDAIKFARTLTSADTYPTRCDDLRIFRQRISNKKLSKLMLDFQNEMKPKD